jgi:hypothetical protein
VSAAWDLVDLPDAVGPWRAGGAISDPDGLVVFGAVGQLPTAWTSPDGREWKSVVLPGGEGFPSSAAASADATVLLGAGGTARCAHPFGEFLWRREHGDPAWNAVEFNELFCAGGFPAIAALEDLFLVAGMGTGDQPFAWRSADGLTWHDAAAGLPFELPPWELAATRGEFMELGRGAQTDARVTADGTEWTSVVAPPAPPAFGPVAPGMDPSALLDTELGLLAVYSAHDASRSAAWRRSPDGTWADVDLTTPPGAVISGGAVANGRPYLFGSRGGVAFVLTSSDQETWTTVQIPAISAVVGLASGHDRTILIGIEVGLDGEEHSVVFETDGLPGDS